MNLSRRALLGLVAGLPFALKAGMAEPSLAEVGYDVLRGGDPIRATYFFDADGHLLAEPEVYRGSRVRPFLADLWVNDGEALDLPDGSYRVELIEIHEGRKKYRIYDLDAEQRDRDYYRSVAARMPESAVVDPNKPPAFAVWDFCTYGEDR
jgi:hypothetical protein